MPSVSWEQRAEDLSASGLIREKLEPVLHWYQSDEHDPRGTGEMVADIVSDLQEDRAACLNAQRIAQDAKRLCEEGHPVSAFNLSMDIRNAIHGLEVWPYQGNS